MSIVVLVSTRCFTVPPVVSVIKSTGLIWPPSEAFKSCQVEVFMATCVDVTGPDDTMLKLVELVKGWLRFIPLIVADEKVSTGSSRSGSSCR